MNCPHGRARGPRGLDCVLCAVEVLDARRRLALSVATRVAECTHPTRRVIDAQVEWCTDCGALHSGARGKRIWERPLYGSEAKALDVRGDLPDVVSCTHDDDSDEKIVKRAKSST